MRVATELPCPKLDLTKDHAKDYPVVMCRAHTENGCPKATKKRRITQMCWRMQRK